MTMLDAVEDALKTGHQFRRREWGGESWPKECCYKSMNVDYCGQISYRYGMYLSVLDLRADDWFMVAPGELLFDDRRATAWDPGRGVLTEGNY